MSTKDLGGGAVLYKEIFKGLPWGAVPYKEIFKGGQGRARVPSH